MILDDECSVKYCYDGYSKEEVAKSIKDAFLSLKDKFRDALEDAGVPVNDIVITGSLVNGNFGCRPFGKVKDEILKIRGLWSDELVEKIDNEILYNTNSTKELLEKATKELRDDGEEGIAKDDLIFGGCSDVDVIVVTDYKPDVQDKSVRLIVDSFESEMEDKIKGSFPVFVNFDNRVYDLYLSDETDFVNLPL